MATGTKRLTFVVTPEMDALLANAKKEFFYDKNQSDMIRELLMAGLNAVENKIPEEIQNSEVLESILQKEAPRNGQKGTPEK